MNEKFEKKGKKLSLKDFYIFIIMICTFYTIAIILSLATNSIFYLVNFMIIGTSVGLGMGLWPVFSKKKKHKARKLSQALVGGYMFFGLGCGLIYIFFGYIQPENMQFEGFWFWLFYGSWGAAVLHYLIAKILGPFLFNRGWCGWACWTAAILDYLPWKKSPGRIKKLGALRYIHFILILLTVITLVFIFNFTLLTIHGIVNLAGIEYPAIYIYNSIFEIPEFWWFIIGNMIYFSSGIVLAAVLKDNRAFCKYLCPITVFLKIGGKFSIVKIEGDADTCNDCKACSRACPMDIDVNQYIKNGIRVTSTECVLCMNCINVCPEKNLKITYKLDKKYAKYMQYKE
jgi:polyferredoxin